jgi:hypothetical protein
MAFDWENLKATLLNSVFRNILVKYVQRGLTYGFGFLATSMAIATPSSDEQAKVVEYIVGAVLILLGMAIDFLHHKLDNSFVLPHPVLFIPDSQTGKPDGPYIPVEEAEAIDHTATQNPPPDQIQG